jgi:hypothetical protein
MSDMAVEDKNEFRSLLQYREPRIGAREASQETEAAMTLEVDTFLSDFPTHADELCEELKDVQRISETASRKRAAPVKLSPETAGESKKKRGMAAKKALAKATKIASKAAAKASVKAQKAAPRKAKANKYAPKAGAGRKALKKKKKYDA